MSQKLGRKSLILGYLIKTTDNRPSFNYLINKVNTETVKKVNVERAERINLTKLTHIISKRTYQLFFISQYEIIKRDLYDVTVCYF